MKYLKGMLVPVVVLGVVLGAAKVSAAEVVGEAADTTAGAGVGASTGLMIGGAAGGPLGALAGAGAGWLLGKVVQQAVGLEERAYEIRGDDGQIRTVRSPKAGFGIGEQVEHRGNRLYALEH